MNISYEHVTCNKKENMQNITFRRELPLTKHLKNCHYDKRNNFLDVVG